MLLADALALASTKVLRPPSSSSSQFCMASHLSFRMSLKTHFPPFTPGMRCAVHARSTCSSRTLRPDALALACSELPSFPPVPTFYPPVET
eukprot:579264-Rhodomonas_salina.1